MPARRRILLLAATLGLIAVGAGGWHWGVRATGPDPLEAVPPETDARPPGAGSFSRPAAYPWPHASNADESLCHRFPPPPGFSRVVVKPDSFQAWLRGLPLKPAGSPVRAFDGRTILAADDPRLAAVLDWDLGTTDLQQCADSAIRLRAEWAWHRSPAADIGFDFTSGDRCSWYKWRHGWRPVVLGNNVRFVKTAAADYSHDALAAYLQAVFRYAGTVSLARESGPAKLGDGQPAFLIHPGSPGHVIMILDQAEAPPTAPGRPRRLAFLLGQGFMPAQDFHILIAPALGAAWHLLDDNADQIVTYFGCYAIATDLRTFPPIANLPEN